MVSPHSLRRLVGGLVLALGFSSLLASSTIAQDRSVPRFGPLVTPDTVQAAPTDLGRLWSMAQPPLDYFEDTYDVRADERGLRHLRLGTVRLPNCSGALVSPQGLVLTAARCVRPFLQGGAGDSLQSGAFVAGEQGEEQGLSGFYAERVVGVETVTDAVAQEGREAVHTRLHEEAGPSERIEIVREGDGTRYVAYTYRRHEDVRLAFYPDQAVTYAGRLGEPLTYPQHAWDVAVLRVYSSQEGQDNSPLQTPDHLSLRRSGARPGDGVFAMGYPAETRRVHTHDQLALRRDLQLPAHLSAVETWTEALRQYADTSAQMGEWDNGLADAQATRTRLQAQLDGLRSDYVMNHLRARDRALQRTFQADTARTEETIIDRLGALQEEKRSYAQTYRAFSFLLYPNYSSATVRRSVLVARAQAEGRSSSELRETLSAVPDQPAALDAALMADHLDRVRQYLETDTVLTRRREQVGPLDSLVRTSVFSDAEKLQNRLLENTLPDDEPVLRLGAALANRSDDMLTAWTALTEKEAPLTDSLARLRHRTDDRPVALPQDRALRMADGRIQGYSYNGTVAPPFTTFYGLYDRHHALSSSEDDLPAPWQSPGDPFERSTPLTTVASTDLGRGAYGGPIVNRSLELVGVAVDGNVQSAAGEYLFLPERMRTVAVDVRGVVEGLSSIYGAERLVQEMTRDGPTP